MIHDTPVWLFDGVCILCSRSAIFVLRHEKNNLIRFVAIQSDEGKQLARENQLDPDNPESFLFIENGVVLRRSDGVLALVAHLDAPARWLRILRHFPQGWRDRAYSALARNRYRLFGKLDSCFVPPSAQRHRFVMPS